MIFNKEKKTQINEIIEQQSTTLNIDLKILTDLYHGKACPKYGLSEPLHVRKVRGGKLVVFNISEKYRGEKISEGRKKVQMIK